jgi:RNA polymerase sigma factor (sigma-70 family)
MMTGVEIADLVQRASKGDQSAWDSLVDAYANLLWSVARAHRLNAHDAADAVQTAWLKLLDNLDKIREPEHLGAWLSTTTRRECLRILRRNGRDIVPAEEALGDAPDPTIPPLDTALLTAERDAQLWALFDGLPDGCRRLLRVLMSPQEPSYADVAAALDMPIGSIGPTRARCLERLRRAVQGTDLTPSEITIEGSW